MSDYWKMRFGHVANQIAILVENYYYIMEREGIANFSTENLYMIAAQGGNLKFLQKLHTKYSNPWNEEVFAAACGSGNLEMVKWLREQDCPWDEYAYFFAAKMKQIEVIRWLRGQWPPCPWGINSCVELYQLREFHEYVSYLFPLLEFEERETK